jgi:hypothetical protein
VQPDQRREEGDQRDRRHQFTRHENRRTRSIPMPTPRRRIPKIAEEVLEE